MSLLILAARGFSRPATTIPFRRKMAQQTRKYTLDTYLVTPSQVNAALGSRAPSRLSTAPRVIPLCASWFLPNDPDSRTGIDVFRAGHIPRAQFFDLDEVKDPTSPYPHMLPTPEDFAKALGQLGIRKDDNVVVYDSKELGIFSAPRVGWTFKIFGHENVHILNNFKLWVEEGYPLEEGDPEPPEPVEYPVPELNSARAIEFEKLKGIVQEQGKEGADEVQILDARSLGRWKGVDPEPRAGLSSGHMPYSKSVPLPELLDPKTKALLPPDELKQLFQKKGVDPSKPIITSCGTGVTAAVIDAALTEAGYPQEQRALYDGSWTEWASRVKPGESLIRTEES